MIRGREMAITFLRKPGELVQEGDIIAEFDTTDETFNLREAEADLAEAEQKVAEAAAEQAAREWEARYELIRARAEVREAELEVRKNPLLAAIAARQNDLALEAARERLARLERDLASRQATTQAALAIQEATLDKARAKAETSRKNIESMTLRAPAPGYVSVQRNTNTNFFYTGMQFPLFQVGDIARPGMAVAQIPDLATWEVSTQVDEADRGHLAVGQKASVSLIALPGRSFTGLIVNLGGTTGPPWDRRFECRLVLEDPVPELRPGMSTRVLITTATMRGVLWIPAQALFEADGRTFVYLRNGSSFTPADVKLVRRSESRVVIEGLAEGQLIALASPLRPDDKNKGAGSASQAIPK
jgi:multidrug efflux pump subunit AcrA (membrane-fusion protein)